MFISKISLTAAALALAATGFAGEIPAADAAEVRMLAREIADQRARLDAMQKRLDALLAKPSEPAPAPVTPASAAPAQPAGDNAVSDFSLQKENTAAAPRRPDACCANHAPAHNAPHDDKTAFSPAEPLTIARAGNSYLNISLVGDIAVGASTKADVGTVQQGGHDPAQRGFTIQGVEMILEGAVDEYFRALGTVIYSLNTEGESFFELEEAYAETLSLPWGLQLRGGQYFTEFGRINTQHPHAWDFVDAPIVTSRFFGPDGLRNPGARLSWLVPTPFYSEIFAGIQNSMGETAYSFRNDYSSEANHDHGHTHGGAEMFGRPSQETGVHGLGDMLYTARYAAAFDLTESQTVLAGISGAWGPNSTGSDANTQIYGADFFWKWKPENQHKGFPFVSIQSEILFRGYDAAAAEIEMLDAAGNHVDVALPAETLWDWGMYAQINYGFTEGWVASLRGDFSAPVTAGEYEKILGEDDASRSKRWRISPALTWYPSEFSRLRLQYNYDRGDDFGEAHSVWLQFEFLLGEHAAHKF